ncbi:MAG: YesL family protein [Anaerobacillus sp.]|uniref:YesL family protein n=1 Tax=Anaerobacillus sp. TaxID=1872506 RepID=UPI00391D1841
MVKGIIGSFYQASEWVVRLAYVNVLWIGFTMLGLVVVGIFPATVAMFTITRKWIKGEVDLPIFNEFWQVYRREFLRSNSIGLIVTLIGAILYFDLYFFYHLDGMFSQVLFYVFVALAFNFAVMLFYIFPVYVHYDLKLFQSLKYALVIGMSNPFHTFSMILCVIFIYFAIEVAPAAFLFLSVAPLSMMFMVIAHRIFVKLEQKQAENVE